MATNYGFAVGFVSCFCLHKVMMAPVMRQNHLDPVFVNQNVATNYGFAVSCFCLHKVKMAPV